MAGEQDSFFSVWRVNMRSRTWVKEAVPEQWEHLGGRALVGRVLLDEVDPNCAPLGPKNKLIFAPGLLVGHMLSSCDRISIGGKSPLTGGAKEANAGGRTGLQLSYLGIKALIIEDRPDDNGWWLLHLSADGARFEPANEVMGMGVYQAAPKLLSRFGDNAAMALIGTAGEMLLHAAGIQNLDKDKVPSRIAARGGLGAVMGSKKLKAVVIDGSSGAKPPLADPQGFKAARKAYNRALHNHPQTQVYTDYGTASMTMLCQKFAALPTRNFSAGTFEGAEHLSGEALRETLLSRGGQCRTSHACMAGCTIQSSNVYGDADGNALVSPLEYETLGMMGSNLGIDDLDTIARLNRDVNDMGLDSIEIGAALGVAADAGLWEFGDRERAIELVREIRKGSALGRVLGSGAVITGKVFGVERVPAAKGQAFSAYDPRATKGTGVTYATSPQGADHTSGLTIRARVDHTDPTGKTALSRGAQYKMAGYDSLGACIFTSFGFGSALDVIADLLNTRYGWDVSPDILEKLGRESIRLERAFNKLAGFTNADDRLPEWLSREPLPELDSVFDVRPEELDAIFDE